MIVKRLELGGFHYQRLFGSFTEGSGLDISHDNLSISVTFSGDFKLTQKPIDQSVITIELINHILHHRPVTGVFLID